MPIKSLIIRTLQKLFSVFPVNKKKIVFLCGGAKYDCNPRYLSEYLGEHTDYIKIWPFFGYAIEKISVPTDVRKVRIYSFRFFWEMSTASIIISNHRLNQLIFKKKKGQKYIQTWHSSIRLKKIEKDAEKYLTEEYKNIAMNDSKQTDIILSGCNFSTDIFRRAFWYEGKIKKTGTPRVDYLLKEHSEITDKINNIFKIKGRSILYAPTFREHSELILNDKSAKEIVNLLSSKTKDSWTFLKRFHPNMRQYNIQNSAFNNIIDVTDYESIQELIIYSDFIISDYSSLIFDCAFIHKPCILYVPDYEEYLEKERELYFKLEELPFPIAKSLEELADILLSFDRKKYNKAIDEFLEKIGSYEDGNACKRIVDLLEQL